jgi:hypothetical protein
MEPSLAAGNGFGVGLNPAAKAEHDAHQNCGNRCEGPPDVTKGGEESNSDNASASQNDNPNYGKGQCQKGRLFRFLVALHSTFRQDVDSHLFIDS